MNQQQQIADGLRELSEALSRNSMWGFFRFAKENDLSPAHMGALMRLAHGEGRGITRMGDEFSMTGAGASQMVDRLVQHGFVERREDPEDRRAKRIVLTELGGRKVRECRDARERWLSELAARLGPEEAGTVLAAIAILSARMREIEDSAPPRGSCAGKERGRK